MRKLKLNQYIHRVCHIRIMYGPKIRHGAYLIENCVNNKNKSFTAFVLSFRFWNIYSDCKEIPRIYFYK